jgi:hypothetical protein
MDFHTLRKDADPGIPFLHIVGAFSRRPLVRGRNSADERYDGFTSPILLRPRQIPGFIDLTVSRT